MRFLHYAIFFVLLSTVFCANNFAIGQDAKTKTRANSDAKKSKQFNFTAELDLPEDIEADKKYPLAIFFASPKSTLEEDKFWRKMLRSINFPALIIRSSDRDWSNFTQEKLDAQIAKFAKRAKIKFDRKKYVLISDKETGYIFPKWIDNYKDLAGAVFVSTIPLEISKKLGLQIWLPKNKKWPVAIWSVCGTKKQLPASNLITWRKFASFAPKNSSVTVDARIGQGGDNLLPSQDIVDWFRAIANGKKPAKGTDYQAALEKKKFAKAAKKLDNIFALTAADTGNKMITKKQGPLKASIVKPLGWKRLEKREQVYNPYNLKADEYGKPIKTGQTDYAEFYLTPDETKPIFARVRFRRWNSSAAGLLDEYAKATQKKTGAITIPYKQWKSGDWTYKSCVVVLYHNGRWYRWFTLLAAKDGTKENPIAPIIVIMDACIKMNSDRKTVDREPKIKTMIKAIKALTDSMKVEYVGKN